MNDTSLYPKYPLAENAAPALKAASNRCFNEFSIDAVMHGELTLEDLHIRDETLRVQAEIARQNGFHRLAENLLRAAELTRVPNDDLLKMYEALRPGRSSQAQLLGLAEALEHKYQAFHVARFVREAVEVYLRCGLLKKDMD